MNLRTPAPVISFLLWSFLLTGQEPVFTASAPAVVRAGEQFQYVIEGSKQGELILAKLNDFQVLAGPFSSYSSSSQWVNGKMTMETVVTYTHVLRANNKGTYTIPGATIKVGRKEYKTNDVQIVVNEGESSNPSPGKGTQGQSGTSSGQAGTNDPVFLRVIPSKKEVYVGEQFVSGLKVYTRVNTRPASATKDIPYEGFYKNSLDPDATAQREDIGGQQYITQVIQRHILIPQKSGNVIIDPYESEWMIQQRVQRRSSNNIFDNFFDDPFFNGVQEIPTKLTTPPVTIHVKPLPPDPPPGFTGGVGDFSMDARLSDNEVAVNEALSLKITIRGTGNLPLLGNPEVNLPPDHDLYDITRSVNTNTTGNRINGSVSFEYPIVARHAGRFRIAPVKFTWFNPVTKKYVTSTTDEFTFNVIKGEAGEIQGNVYVPGVLQESVEDLGTDIRDIVRVTVPFTPLQSTLLGKQWYWMLYLLAIFIMTVVIILIRTVARRNADIKLVRNRQANKIARSRLKKAERFRKTGVHNNFYEEIGKAIWGYLADKLSIEISALSKDVILDKLEARGVADEIRNEFVRIIEASEFSRFAPSSEKSDVDILYRDTVSLFKNLENSL